MATQLAGLPDPAPHRTPPAAAAREALLERLRHSEPGTYAPVEDVQEIPEMVEHNAPPQAIQLSPAAATRKTPEDMLKAVMEIKSPEEVFLMVLERMPAPHVLTTKVGKWNIEMNAISCTVDDTQLNFVADKRKNQCLPDEVGGEYKISFRAKEYDLRLLGVSFFPSPSSPFVLVSFLRMVEPNEP